jgi:hypothetical protein
MESRYQEPYVGYLPMVLASAFGITMNANGFSLVTGLPFLAGMGFAMFIYVVKMKLIVRSEPDDSESRSIGRSLLGYAAQAVLFITLGAFGLFGFGGRSSAGLLLGLTLPENGGNEVAIAQNGRGHRETAELYAIKGGGNAENAAHVGLFLTSGDGKNLSLLRYAPPVEALKASSFLGFVQATIGKSTFAIICWIVVAVLEFVVIILMRQIQIEQSYRD